MGGSKASGAGLNPFVEPRAVGVACRRMAGLMIYDVEETNILLSRWSTAAVLHH